MRGLGFRGGLGFRFRFIDPFEGFGFGLELMMGSGGPLRLRLIYVLGWRAGATGRPAPSTSKTNHSR